MIECEYLRKFGCIGLMDVPNWEMGSLKTYRNNGGLLCLLLGLGLVCDEFMMSQNYKWVQLTFNRYLNS
jgi:hypothetical protein